MHVVSEMKMTKKDPNADLTSLRKLRYWTAKLVLIGYYSG